MKRCSVLSVLLCAACSGAGPDVPELSSTPLGTYGIYLAWTHPSGEAYDGYVVEHDDGITGFSVLAIVDAARLGSGVFFAQLGGEQAIHSFRVRAMPDPDGSRTSNVVTARIGVLTPQILCGQSGFPCRPTNNTRFDLAWTPVPGSTDSYRIERHLVAADGSDVGDWVTLVPSLSANTYSDTDLSQWVHRSSYRYRLTAIGKAGEEGGPTTTLTDHAPP